MKVKRLLASLILGLGLILAFLWLLTDGSVGPVYANTYTVTNTNASGIGSLRQAIVDANENFGHDTIDFGITGTIVLSDALPAIKDDLTISGPGAGRLAVSGGNAWRVFSITHHIAVTITGVTVRDGNVSDNGGGVWSAGDLYLEAVHIISNTASDDGGGVYISDGSATLTETQITTNSAYWGGGGVYVSNDSVLNVNGSEISNNSAYGPWGRGGGLYVYDGKTRLFGTEVIDNLASNGGGVYISRALGSATLNVSGGEISSNSASGGGGMYVSYGGSATLTGTRIIGNSAYKGGGVYVCGRVHVYDGSATLKLSGGEISSNSASWNGGGVYVDDGSVTLSGTQITTNNAADGSALYTRGIVTAATALTITGDVYQKGGFFAGNRYNLCIEGSLNLVGGDFYAPNAPYRFTLTGPFTHTAGVYHQTQAVNGNSDVGFPKAGGVILNANGQDLGSTEVALTAGDNCAGVTAGEAISHCYIITPTNSNGRDAVLTFFYRNSEIPSGHSCTALEAYLWNGTWDNILTRETTYAEDGRMCGADPLSIRVTGVTTFSSFVLAPPTPRLSTVYLPLICRRWPPIPYTPDLHAIDNADGDGDYTVSWGQANLADTYTLEEDDNPAFSSPTTQYSGSELSWGANDKAPGTYYYRVKATNSWGDSGWSNVESVSVVPSTMKLYAHIDDEFNHFLSPERNAGASDARVIYHNYPDHREVEFSTSLSSDIMGTQYTYSIAASENDYGDYSPATCDVEILFRRDGKDTVLASWSQAFTVDSTIRSYTGSLAGFDPDVQPGDMLILRIRAHDGSAMIWLKSLGYSHIQVPGYAP